MQLPQLLVGDVTLDLFEADAWRANQRLGLTHNEFKMLLLLVLNEGQPVSRAEIHQRVFGLSFDPLYTNRLEVTICRLRDKLVLRDMVINLPGRAYAIGAKYVHQS